MTQWGIAGLALFMVLDKLLYAVLRKKDKTERGATVESLQTLIAASNESIKAMSAAIVSLTKHFEGVDFRRMEMEIHWLKETHAATDPSGRLRWYDQSGELKETMDELKNEIRTLGNKIERLVSSPR